MGKRLSAALMAIAVAGIAAASALAQAPNPGTVSSIDRFMGGVTMALTEGVARTPERTPLQYQIWNLAPGVKLAGLPLRSKGNVIYELRAGKLTTIIDGKSEQRREGEFWVVRSNQTIEFQSDDDNVVVHTILLPAQ
jgi:gentisate 1,2-dioxygenase